MSALNYALRLPLMLAFLLLAACGGGGGSDDGGSTPAAAKLAAPGGANASVTAIATNHEIVLSWDAVAGASSYNLYYAQEPITDTGNYAALNGGTLVPDITTTSFTLSEADLNFPADYYFRLTTNNSAGEGAPSDQVHAFVAVGGINDTGITTCGDYAYPGATPPSHNNDVDCAAAGATKTTAGAETTNGNNPVPAGQDALYGRDANPATNSDADGLGGFSYTKLSANDGSPLAIQTSNWAAAGSEASGSHWGCVRDNVTGLIWETKLSDASSARDVKDTYTWYNSSLPATMQGEPDGAGNGARCPVPANEGPAQCNTEAYVAYVNSIQLCGFNDWRLPASEELLGLVNWGKTTGNMSGAALGPTGSNYYWSASQWTTLPYTDSDNVVWLVYSDYGREAVGYKNVSGHVRLVRAGQ